MFSHYAQEPTSHANMLLSVHERINDLHRRAYGLAPAVAESAADSGCTNGPGTYKAQHAALSPRRRMAWDMIAEAHGWNAVSDLPAMLAEAERCEAASEPYFVGYESTKRAEFTTALALDTDGAFIFGVWGQAQPELKACAECAAPCDGTLTAEDEMSGTDVPVCVTCHPLLTLVSEDNQPHASTDMLLAAMDAGARYAPQITEDGCVCRLGPDCPTPGRCSASAIAADQPEHGPEWWVRAVAGQCSHGGHGWDGETCSDAYDDFSLCAPMFAAVEPGNAWLRAQDAGVVTYTVYDWTADSGQIALISLDLEFAMMVAGWKTGPYGSAICRSERMCGTWLYDDLTS